MRFMALLAEGAKIEPRVIDGAGSMIGCGWFLPRVPEVWPPLGSSYLHVAMVKGVKDWNVKEEVL